MARIGRALAYPLPEAIESASSPQVARCLRHRHAALRHQPDRFLLILSTESPSRRHSALRFAEVHLNTASSKPGAAHFVFFVFAVFRNRTRKPDA